MIVGARLARAHSPLVMPVLLAGPAMKFTRSHSDKVLAGVCGGIARYFGWSAGRTRVVYVLLTLLSAAFPGVILYLALWFLAPLED